LDYNKILTLSTELGRHLMCSGAEISRVEDSIRRLVNAYGLPHAQVFAIPSCLIVSLTPPDGQPFTSICRIPSHGIDLDLLELCNALCRRLCQEVPEPEQALQMVRQIDVNRPRFSPSVTLAGHFLVGAFFTPFFGGSLTDLLCGGLCGVVLGLSNTFLTRSPGSHPFMNTAISSAVASCLAQLLTHWGLGSNTDAITIGALMLLVPGVSLTTAMRDIVANDTISGIARLSESVLTATAIAIGVGAALALGRVL